MMRCARLQADKCGWPSLPRSVQIDMKPTRFVSGRAMIGCDFDYSFSSRSAS